MAAGMTDIFLRQLTGQLRALMSENRTSTCTAESKRKEINTLMLILRSHPEIEEEILIALLLTPGVQDASLYIDLLDLVCHAPKVVAVVGRSARLCDVLTYISQVMGRIMDKANNCLDSPSAHSAQLGLLLKSEQLVCKVMQAAAPHKTQLPSEAFRALVEVLLRITREVNVIDCLSAASMIAVLVMRRAHGDDFEAQIHECLEGRPASSGCAEGLFSSTFRHSERPLPRLCAFHGLTGMLEPAVLAWAPEGRPASSLLLLRRLHEEPSVGSLDHSTKLLHCRCLHLWHKKMTDITPLLNAVSCAVFRSLTGLAPSVQFIFNHLEDPIDIVKYQSREMMEFLVKSHQKVCQDTCPSCPPISALLSRVLELSWLRTGKFALLSALCALRGGPSRVLASSPDLPALLVCHAGADQCLASHAADLFGKLLLSSVKTQRKDGSLEVSLWARPVFKSLLVRHRCHDEEAIARRSLVCQYFLPKLVKHLPECLEYLVDSFCPGSAQDNVGAVISVFRRAKLEGTLTPERQARLTSDLLRSAIVHHDQQVRLDAFALLCEHKKSSAPVPQCELDIIFEFLRENMDGQTPAYRQQLASFLKKLFARLCDGSSAAQRRLQKTSRPEDEAIVANYARFSRAVRALLLQILEPGVSFPRRITSLASLCVCREMPGAERYQLSARETGHLLLAMTDSFEENRSSSFKLLSEAPEHLLPLIPSLQAAAFSLARSVRPQDSAIASGIFRLLSSISKDFTKDCALFSRLMADLQDQVVVARVSLLRAAASQPLYPTLHCLRDFVERCSPQQLTRLLEQALPKLLELCYSIGELVSPVVANASPEGNCPLGPGLNVGAALETADGGAGDEDWTAARMPEFLVVCCWRSVKEVSLTLGSLTAKLVEADGLQLTQQQVLRIGSFFREQLLESRHRGAFELAAAGFQQLCETLWRASSPELACLPEAWLKEVLLEIRKDNSELDLCATRRSAGLPHFVKAIVASQPVSSSRTTLLTVMSSLMEVATEAAVESSLTENFALIHALNILRTLFRDASLGEETQSFVPAGVRSAVVGFSSPLWSIRNSATMLFSALMQRIFGVSRSKDESSKKNRLSSRVFFNRYPVLYDFLLDQLSLCSGPNRECQARLYPLLLLLSRLLPPAVEASDSSLRLDPFVPLVHACGLRSRDLRVRALAARALVPLVHRSRLTCFTLHLIEKGLDAEVGAKRANVLHGLLLQIDLLLAEIISEGVASSSELLQLLSSLLYRSGAVLSGRCPVVKASLLRCASYLIAAAPCQRTVELFFRFLGPHLLPLLSDTSRLAGATPDALPGQSEQLRAFSAAVFALLEVLEGASRRSNVPLDLTDSGLDFLQHLLLCRACPGVRTEACVFLCGLLTRCGGPKKRQGDVCRRLKARAGPVMAELAARVAVEDNADALAALLAALADLSVLVRPQRKEKLLLTVATLLRGERRQEVVAAALPLVGRLWPDSGPPVNQSSLTGGSKDNRQLPAGGPTEDRQLPAGGPNDDILRELVAALHQRCGWDQGPEMREACSKAVRSLFGRGAHRSDDSQIVFPLWDALLTLLNDFEPSVRAEACALVAALSPADSATPRAARTSFNLALSIFTKENERFGSAFWDRVRGWMLHGLESDTEVVEHQEIRLFERGEMNIFMDQAALARSLASCLLDSELPRPPSAPQDPPRVALAGPESWPLSSLFGEPGALEGRSLQALRERLWANVGPEPELRLS